MTSTANHILRNNTNRHPWRYLHETIAKSIYCIPCSHSVSMHGCDSQEGFHSDLFCFLCPSSLGKDRVRIFGKSSVDIPGLKSSLDIDVTEYSLIDLSSALHTVATDSFVVKNYQVPFLRSKTRLKNTLIKVADEPSVYEMIQRQRKASSRKKTTTINCCVACIACLVKTWIYCSHLRNKRTSCNCTADKHEIMSYEIHGSHVFIDSIYLALSDVLQLIQTGKPKQISQS